MGSMFSELSGARIGSAAARWCSRNSSPTVVIAPWFKRTICNASAACVRAPGKGKGHSKINISPARNHKMAVVLSLLIGTAVTGAPMTAFIAPVPHTHFFFHTHTEHAPHAPNINECLATHPHHAHLSTTTATQTHIILTTTPQPLLQVSSRTSSCTSQTTLVGQTPAGIDQQGASPPPTPHTHGGASRGY
jgi:hypothetical protein